MIDFFNKNKRSPIALDIGSENIKMFQMQSSAGVISALACGRWDFPLSSAGDARQRQKLAVEAVREMLCRNGFVGKKAATVLSSDVIDIKNIRLPHLPAHELKEAVKWEAKERFGFEINDDRLKYLNAGEVRQGTETQDEIIMLAVEGKVIAEHLAMLEQMGLSAESIEVEPVAVFRTFERFLRRKEDEQTVSVIIDIGWSSTRVIVARGRQIVFIKNITVGGRNLDEAVSKQLNLSLEESHNMRIKTIRQYLLAARQPEQPPEDSIAVTTEAAPVTNANSIDWTLRDTIRAEAEALAREISLCLRYCTVTFRGLRPANVIVTGGEAYDVGLVELLRENLSMNCMVGQPMRGIDISSVDFGVDRRGMLAEWTVCTGLATTWIDSQQLQQEKKHGLFRLSA